MRRCDPSSAFSRALALKLALLLCAAGSQAAGTPIPHGALELIAENQWIAPGHEFALGLHFQLEKGWHIYWVNPGDSGEPPSVKWQLPAGLTPGTMEWPTPRRFGTSSIVDFGYERSVMLMVPMHAEASLAAQRSVQLGAEVRVLVCREMCIPGRANLSVTLPIKSRLPAPDARTSDLFAATRRSLPRPAPGKWRFVVDDAKDSFVLTANLGHRITQAIFFPLAESQIDNAAPQEVVPLAAGFRLTLRKSDQLLKPIERLKGVLVLSARRAYLIDVLLKQGGRGEKELQHSNPSDTILGGGTAEMKHSTLYPMLVALVLCTAPLLISAVKVGEAAPDFTATASNGKTLRLSDYRGKYVVLEWHNNGCPYVRKHYNSGNMQRLQKKWTGRGVIWFTILSSAPGKQGYVTASEENDYLAKMQAAPTAALLDPTGEIGHLYDAKTSPQMVVINPQGLVIYDGAIDDKPTTDLKDVPGATNYVNLALEQAMAGKQVETPATRPYGCSVKYLDATH
jgi:DsbC/DsbD-like thiol-disulfide interchange protein